MLHLTDLFFSHFKGYTNIVLHSTNFSSLAWGLGGEKKFRISEIVLDVANLIIETYLEHCL